MTLELTVEEKNFSRLKVEYRVQRKIRCISKMVDDVANPLDSLLTEVGKLKWLCEYEERGPLNNLKAFRLHIGWRQKGLFHSRVLAKHEVATQLTRA